LKKIVRRSARIVAVFILCLFVWLSAAHTLAGRAPQQDKQKTKGARDAPTLYAKTCATCHGKDGRAKTFKAKFNKARDLTDVAWQKEASDERLFNSITNGRGKMPAFGRKFSESEINELVAFVRQLKK
jgi:mono/diheme cytochrome c family protein